MFCSCLAVFIAILSESFNSVSSKSLSVPLSSDVMATWIERRDEEQELLEQITIKLI